MFKRKLSILLAVALVTVALAGFTRTTRAQTSIKVFFGSVGDLKPNQNRIDAFMKANPDIKVEIVYGPQSATDYLAQIQQVLAAKSGDLDVFQYDTIWPGILAARRASPPGQGGPRCARSTS